MMEKPPIFKTKSRVSRGTAFVDIFPQALEELFFVEHPRFRKGDPAASRELKKFVSGTKIKAVWAYYPWRRLAARIPEENIYFRLRTARNRNLITEKEQRNYREFVLGIAGLSVGSSALSALVMCGGPKTIKIADPDTVDITNLNRIRAKIFDVGENKTEIAAREVWELDPFADIRVYRQGLRKENIAEFMGGKPRLGAFLDEMDNIALKIESRLICRKLGIPVVMATDNGDGVIVDVERYDLERKRPIFHGQVDEKECANGEIKGLKAIQMAAKIIDPAYFTERQQDSIMNIGKTLAGVAQIGTAAAIAGAAAAYAIRQIANGHELPSGRYVIMCEKVFAKGYDSAKEKKRRASLTKKFIKAMGM